MRNKIISLFILLFIVIATDFIVFASILYSYNSLSIKSINPPNNATSVMVDIKSTNVEIIQFNPTTQYSIGRCQNNTSYTNNSVCADLVFIDGITDNIEIGDIT